MTNAERRRAVSACYLPRFKRPMDSFRSRRSRPLGCDTFVAYPPATKNAATIFGKNSDRPTGERQSIRVYPARPRSNEKDAVVMLQCTYIAIPDEGSCAVLLSQIDWMWGAEMGANEHGVVIGNEAVWTRVDTSREKLLLGMDLVRLGLERSTSADEALNVITSLLTKHGQGGPCAQDDETFTYHNSFLIADASHAWVLETAGEHWVAQKVSSGTRNISNGLTIRTEFDLHSDGLHAFAQENGLWDGKSPLDFAACFSSGGVDSSLDSRQACGCTLMSRHDNQHSLDANAMMAILRDHESGICMHGGGFETTASMVSELTALRREGDSSTGEVKSTFRKHWMTGKPFPCRSDFVLQSFPY
jgi:secernin